MLSDLLLDIVYHIPHMAMEKKTVTKFYNVSEMVIVFCFCFTEFLINNSGLLALYVLALRPFIFAVLFVESQEFDYSNITRLRCLFYEI